MSETDMVLENYKKLEKEYEDLKKEFGDLIIKSTSNLFNEIIFTPIIIKNRYADQIVMAPNGILKWSNCDNDFEDIELNEYKKINWAKLKNWIVNNSTFGPDIFHKIKNAVFKFNLIAELDDRHSYIENPETGVNYLVKIDKSLNFIYIPIGKFNKKIDRCNKLNRKVLGKLKEELDYKLFLEEL